MTLLMATDVWEIFDFNPERGELVWRYRSDRAANWNARYPGTVAGAKDAKGYIHIAIDRRFYAAHRLIWMFAFGAEPDGEVDHRNGNRSDNRVANLRVVTRSQNRQNSAARGPWPKGVYLYRRDGSFRAQIKQGGVNTYLGIFSTPEAAHQAYAAEATRRFGEFACLDR